MCTTCDTQRPTEQGHPFPVTPEPRPHTPLDPETYQAYVDILHEELIVATGCTEPIAVAYASALAAQLLGTLPEQCRVAVSGNIVKNVNSVTVPNTGGLHGIAASVAAGVIGGVAEKQLDVLSEISDEERLRIRAYLDEDRIQVELAETDEVLYIDISLSAGDASAHVIMAGSHTNVILAERNGEQLCDGYASEPFEQDRARLDILNVARILDFADTVKLDDVREVLERQISYNCAIAQEGLKTDWGARVGKLYNSDCYGCNTLTRAKAAAAAGSDARMSGCPMPVVIISGSGNQGITASVPIAIYAQEYGIPHDEMLRALLVSDLIAIYQKRGIGCLSAFCGAISAGIGAAAGIAYMFGGGFETVSHTIVNALGVISGMVCDGAKPSCAAKIAASLDAGIFGLRLYENGNEFFAGDGIVTMGVDETIRNVSRMAREGMRETDHEILKIMIEQQN